MKKILVLENIDEMESVLRNYISKNYPESEIKLLTNLPRRSKEEIIAGLKWCDTLMVMSIFGRTDQMESFISLIDTLKINPEVHLIHSQDQLLAFLNLTIENSATEKLKRLLRSGLTLYNVHYSEYEEKEKSGSYFKKLSYRFSPVKMFVNEKEKLIFDERQVLSDKFDESLYKYKAYFLSAPPLNNGLSKEEIAELKLMLSEQYAQLDDLIEDLEYSDSFEEKEKEELKASHLYRQSILDKMKIGSFK